MTMNQIPHVIALSAWYFWPIPFIAVAESVSIGTFPFGSLTSTGVLCWYVWHTNSKALPRIEKAHTNERRELQTIIKSQVESNKESSQAMATAMDKLSEAINRDRRDDNE